MGRGIGTRYRLVTITRGEWHVSVTVLAADEWSEALSCEAALHRAAGWDVIEDPDDEWAISCRRGHAWRLVTVQAFTPMSDTPREPA